MDRQDMEALAALLESLTELDRQAGCSDRFFRQVYTARIRALAASGIPQRLKAALEGERNKEENG